MAFGPSLSPSQRFRLALLHPSSSLAHLQRLAQKLPDLRNTDPSSRQTSLALAVAANRYDVASWLVDEGHEEGEISRVSPCNGSLRCDEDGLGAWELTGYCRTRSERLAFTSRPRTAMPTCCSCTSRSTREDLAFDLPLGFRNADPGPRCRFVLDWVNSRGATPLHIAAMKGEVECAQVRCGIPDDAVIWASGGEGVLTVAPPLQVLIEAGAELDAPDLQGNTPIHYASSWGHIVVRLW